MAARIRTLFNTYPKILWFLAIGAFLNVGGLSFIWPINSIYITQELGKPLTVAGIVLLLHSAGASLGHLSGGILFDKIGARPVILLGLLSSSVLMILIGLYDAWPLYITVMALYGFTASLVFPAINALAAKSWPEGGRRAFNFIYVANNLGVAIGTAVGGLVAAVSFQLAFYSAAFTFVVFAVFVFLFIRDRQPRDPEAGTAAQTASAQETAAASATLEQPIPWVPVWALFAGFIVLWMVYVQWQTSISVYMQEISGISLSAYSLLWTINGLLIFLGQPLVTYTVRIFKSLASQMFVGLFLYVASFGLLLTGDSYPLFLAGMVIMTLGEMLLWPGIPAAVAQLSPPSRTGFLQGLIGSGATIGRMLGPLFGGLLYDHTSFHTLLLVMVSSLAVPLVCFLLYRRSVKS